MKFYHLDINWPDYIFCISPNIFLQDARKQRYDIDAHDIAKISPVTYMSPTCSTGHQEASIKIGISIHVNLSLWEEHPQSCGCFQNRGTPKSSILIGFSIINHPFWGTPIFGNTHIWKNLCCREEYLPKYTNGWIDSWQLTYWLGWIGTILWLELKSFGI